jgi:hypothetical protein
VSGEPTLRLVVPSGSPTADLVRVLARLGESGPAFCLVGGLAVLARVGSAYRATSDIDAVAEESAAVVASLQARAGARRTANGVAVGGATLDVIEIGPIASAEDLPADPAGRHFVLAHRFAFDTAEQVAIEVVDAVSAAPVVRAEVAAATPAALVAMKLGAYPARRGLAAAKQGSDLLDLLALLDGHDGHGAVAAALRAAPHDLGPLCIAAARSSLVDDATVAAGRIRRYTATDVDEARIERLARRFVAGVTATGRPPDRL